MDGDPEASVFKALSDPTRRAILDLLFERGGRTLGELVEVITERATGPAMSRYGVMKHVRVLEEAALVVTRPDGRRTLHYLNPMPIRMANRRWIDKYSEPVADGLLALKIDLEKPVSTDTTSTDTTSTDTTRQLYQVFIRADAQRIWDALTLPDQTVRYFHNVRMTVDSERLEGRGPAGELWMDAPVEVWDPPHRLVYGWQLLDDSDRAGEPLSRVTFEIEPAGEAVCKLTLVHDKLEASPKTADRVRGEGWMYVLSNLKTFVETGEPLRAAG
jgi:uncharacterized protein YndB with AHSA1/START domain/DNA-binding transcriptional ArsR family regulator